jgi:glycerol-3-phosphate acyltransferase PlsY
VAVVVSLVLAYFLGTIPSAVVVSRIATKGTVDIRQVGSGNPGAMNTLQQLGSKWGAIVLLVDIGKAIAACVLARVIAGEAAASYAGSAAVIGHCFPVWFRFKGGKGIASAGGQCLATFPVYAPIALAVTVLTSRRRFEAQATMAAYFTAAVWVTGAVVWTVADLPNLWGIEPGAALIGGGAISGLVIAYRFVTAAKTTPLPPAPAAS